MDSFLIDGDQCYALAERASFVVLVVRRKTPHHVQRGICSLLQTLRPKTGNSEFSIARIGVKGRYDEVPFKPSSSAPQASNRQSI